MADDECCCCASWILGPLFGLFALIGLLCMTAGYLNNMNINGSMVHATCLSTSYQILPDSCYRSCCTTDSKGKCVGCSYICYSGYVTASIENITTGTVFKAFTDDLYTNVNAYLTVHYPSGKLFSCYYTFGTSVSIFLGLTDVQGPYIAGLVFLGLAAAVGLVWLIISIPYLFECFGDCCGVCCSGCCNSLCAMFADPFSSCRRSIQAAKEKRDQEKLQQTQKDLENAEALRQMEAQLAKAPSAIHIEQFPQNPAYVGEREQIAEIAETVDANDLAQPKMEIVPNASAPPLTNSTFIEIGK